ncbi:MAG: hypothetical protein ACJ78G_07680 [Gemmatimonadaceae bacterium]
MTIRRLAGLLLSVLSLQLNFRASDLVCAAHDGGRSSHAGVAAGEHHEMAMSADHTEQSAGEKQSCEIPVTRDCCQALTSCAMTLDACASPTNSGISLDRARAASATADAPASLIQRPEPPPPKL